jgi:hypothetical protein
VLVQLLWLSFEVASYLFQWLGIATRYSFPLRAFRKSSSPGLPGIAVLSTFVREFELGRVVVF